MTQPVEWQSRMGYAVNEPMHTMRIEIPEYAQEAFGKWYEVVKKQEWFEGMTSTFAILAWIRGFEAGRK